MNENIPNPAGRARQGTDYAEHEEVQQVHAAIQREKREPLVGLEPLSMWLVVIYGLALFFGGAYLARFSGTFSGESLDIVYGPPMIRNLGTGGPAGGAQQVELSPTERGKKIFSANCATCHQMTGQGVPGQYPPLAGSEFVNGGTRRLGMIVLKGLTGPIKVKGQTFITTAQMQPWERTLTDQKLADVLTYVRQEWGNTGGPVAPEGIAGLRKEIFSRTESLTEHDLDAVPADAELPGGQPAAPAAGAPPKPAGSPAASPPPKA
jgi:mono/diheme cytochrome c family protein